MVAEVGVDVSFIFDLKLNADGGRRWDGGGDVGGSKRVNIEYFQNPALSGRS